MQRGAAFVAIVAFTGLAMRCAPFGSDETPVDGDAGMDAASSAFGDAGANLLDAGTVEDAAVDDAGQLFTSCAAIHAADPLRSSGTFSVAPPSGPLDVYCDMTTADGGWTLVARSVMGATVTPFGWKQDKGSVLDDTKPYSLDATKLAPFTEIMFGTRGTGKTWKAPVFQRSLPADFVNVCSTVFAAAAPSTDVTKKCPAPLAGSHSPSMVAFAGMTNTKDHFVFTDNIGNSSFGLTSSAWNTNGQYDVPAKCTYSGLISDTEGMIFVR